MKYYNALGHVRATLISRSFGTEDEAIQKGALDDVLEAMGTIVFPTSSDGNTL
jgi:hypothetical protein